MRNSYRRIMVGGMILGIGLITCIVAAFWLGSSLAEWRFAAFGGLVFLSAASGVAFLWLLDRWQSQALHLRRTESGQELADVFENTVIGLHRLAEDGTILWANRAELELLGYSWDEYVGRPIADFHADPATLAAIQQRLASGEALRNIEVQLRGHDGLIHHVLMDTHIHRRDGKFVHIQSLSRDITNQRRAEEDARESEERFRFLADKAPVLIWMSGPSMGFDFLNRYWLEFTGRTADQEIGGGWLDSIHPDDRTQCWDAYSSAFEDRRAFTVEYRLRRQDGQFRWVLNTGVPRFTKTGFFFGYIGSCIDISDRKRSEEEQQRDLRALEEQDRRKDEFLAVLSHELRNPLAPILNALHILRGANFKEIEFADARAVIERQIQLLAGIVDDLLDVFRIAHQKLALRREPINVSELVRNLVEDHRIALEGSRLQISVEVPQEPVWVLADRTRLAQIMNNLLNNTAKFTNPGDSVLIQVAQDKESNQTVIKVRDSGVGIAPDMLARVFETFTQADRTLDRSKGGLGLGLALVKGLVELHGGSVHLHSAGRGKGTSVAFRLPLGSAPPEVVTPSEQPINQRALRILIVEDNRDTAKTLGILLSRSGHRVQLAHTGPEGIEVAKVDRPDVVLCDLGLPEMDGYQVAQALRRDPSLHDVRMIAVSGYGQDEDRRRSAAAGFDLHLNKPVDPVDLQRLLSIIKVGV
jgi:PAS domain S-box-containing protein